MNNSSSPFVDIHCHLLPQIDDGARDWEESLAMARLAVAEGIRTIIATPHQLGNHARNRGETIRAKVDEFNELLGAQGVPLDVLPGADVRIEPDLVSRVRSGDVLSLADQRTYVLLELPHEVYLPLDRLLGELQAAGMVGILSHPERNQGILGQPRVLEDLLARGCLMQITAGSLAGTFGTQSQAMAERMVVQGIVHFVATDAHGVKSRRPLMQRAFRRVAQLAGVETANRVCSVNPACVVANRRLASPGRRPASGSRKPAGGPRKPAQGGWRAALGGLFGWRKAS